MQDDDETYGPRAQHQLDEGRDPDDVVASLVQDGVPPPRAQRVVRNLLRDEPKKSRLRGIAMIAGGLCIAWAGFGAAGWTDRYADAMAATAGERGMSERRAWRRTSSTRTIQVVAFGAGLFGLLIAGVGVRAIVSGGRALDGKRSTD